MDDTSTAIVSLNVAREVPIIREQVGGLQVWVRAAALQRRWDLSVARPIIEGDEYELLAIRRAFGDSIRTIVDVGGHIGSFAVFAKSLWRNAKIISAEPDPESAAIFLKNISDLSEVELHAAALACPGVESVRLASRKDFAGHSAANFVVEQGNTGQPHVESDAGVTRVPATCLSAILARAGVERIDILKVDCEGGETDVFEDLQSSGWLERVRWIRGEWHGRHRLGQLTRLLSEHHEPRFCSTEQHWGYFIAHHRLRA